jgi:hypothetical protein
MPVTQTESAGQMITFTIPKDNGDFAVKMVELPDREHRLHPTKYK